MELRAGYKQTEIGVIPEDWEVKKFCHMVEGGKIPSGIYKDKNLYGTGAAIIKLGDVFKNNFFQPTTVQRVQLNKREIDSYKVKIGDICIALASVKLEGVGKVMLINKLDESTTFDHNVALIRLTKEYSDVYICNLFNSSYIRSLIGSKATQVGTTFLKASTILQFSLALPPTKTEQTAIAKALSDADALIQQLEKFITKKRHIKQGAMQALLNPYDDNGKLKMGWTTLKLGEVAEIRDGTHQTPKYVDSGVPFYSVENVTRNDFKNTKFISVNEHKLLTKTLKMEKGDILMTRIGSIGDCKLIDWDVDASFYVSLALLKLKESISPKYFLQFSKTHFFQKELEINSLQFAIPKKINLSQLANVLLAIPYDVEQQTAIAKVLSDMDTEITALETKLAKTQQLKQGMMQTLLTGSIRLIDPNQ